MRNTIFSFVIQALVLTAGLLPALVVAQTSPSEKAVEAVVATEQPEAATQISTRSVVVMNEFSINDKTGWPYDSKQMQFQSVAELKAKCGSRLDVLVGPPASARVHTYTLSGEVINWHPGNRAKRMMVGMGSGRETAEIHYWLTDEQGKKVFEHKDTIRAEFWGNAYEGSVGQLAHPFASKIAARLTEAKLF